MTAPARDWWLVVRRDGVPHCWQVGDPTPERTEELVDRARVLLGIAAGEAWLSDPDISVDLTCGRPHPQLLSSATVHDVSDLDDVAAAALTAYHDEGQAEHRRTRLHAAREAIALLTPAEHAALREELPAQPGR